MNMQHKIFIAVGILLVLGLGGYWIWPKKTSQPAPVVQIGALEETSKTLEDILAHIPDSPINVVTNQAAWPTHEIDGEIALVEKLAIQPLVDLKLMSTKLLQGWQENNPQWCTPYLDFQLPLPEGVAMWDAEAVRQQVEDERTERSAQRTAETEKRYETWSLWFVGMDEQVALDEEKKSVKKPLERLQKDFDDITDSYQEELDTVLQTVNQQFDELYTSMRQAESPAQLWRSLGTLISVNREQSICPDFATLTSSEQTKFQAGIRQWQNQVESAIRRLNASKAERIRLATQATLQFQTGAQKHENEFDAVLSAFLRSVKE